ncbi:MAG: hypothetical protein HYX67_07875 [Candidatus Melainabacteria bacterium]|nr:hypothetical protein [Candidatus Melainabacteria bacterium]
MPHNHCGNQENFDGRNVADSGQGAHRNIWNHDLRNADFKVLDTPSGPDTAQHHLTEAHIDENGITFNSQEFHGRHHHRWQHHGHGNGGGCGDQSGSTGDGGTGTQGGTGDRGTGTQGGGTGDGGTGIQGGGTGDGGTGTQGGGTGDGSNGTTNGGDGSGNPHTNPGGDGSGTPNTGGDSGPLTLPTASPAEDLKAALANAAGPNDNPNVVPVRNDDELKNALQNAKPGDVIQLASGTYSPISINNSGRAGAPITVEAAPGAHATIDVNHAGADYGPGYAGVLVNGNYIAVRGLDITDSHYDANSDSTPTPNGNGIMIGTGYAQDAHQHNITIENNWVHNLPGSGISDEHGDNVAIVGNKVEYTSRLSPYGVSGIGTFELNDSDGRQGAVGVYVLNNEVHDNFQVVPSTAIGANVITDGNGIILDTNQGYDKWTLVEGNNVYNNGRGIHAFNSPYVRIQGNTAVNNNKADWGLNNIDSNDPTDQVGTNTTT